MLVLDTKQLPENDRNDAFQSVVADNCSTLAASLDVAGVVQAEVTWCDLGPARILNVDASGTVLRRTPRMARAADDGAIVLALPMRVNNHLMWQREDREYGPGDLMLVDVSAPYVYHWPEGGGSWSFHVDHDELGLPMDVVHRAAVELRTSPLYGMVRDHIAQVTANMAAIENSAAKSHVAAASVELVHALIVSAAGDARRTAASMHASAAARVQTYVRHHLREPDLDPVRVAAANGLSVRALYKVYEALGTSLEQSIIEQRLRGARADLAAPAAQHLPIATVARSWGFASPSFFAQRFRLAFGVTPRQWRATATSAPPARTSPPVT